MKVQAITFPTMVGLVLEPAARLLLRDRAYFHCREISIDHVEGETDEERAANLESIRDDLRNIASSFEKYIEAADDAAIRIPAGELPFLVHVAQPSPEFATLTEAELETNYNFRVWRFLSSLTGAVGQMQQGPVPDEVLKHLTDACHNRLSAEIAEMARNSPSGAVKIDASGAIVPFDGPVEGGDAGSGQFAVIGEQDEEKENGLATGQPNPNEPQ